MLHAKLSIGERAFCMDEMGFQQLLQLLGYYNATTMSFFSSHLANHPTRCYLCIMLKRISVLTMLLLYLVTASGFALNLHYCGNYISSIKIDAPAPKCSPVKMKCCRDGRLDVKVKDAHQVQAHFVFAKLFLTDLLKAIVDGYLLPVQQLAVATHTYRGPPDRWRTVPIYLTNRVFLI